MHAEEAIEDLKALFEASPVNSRQDIHRPRQQVSTFPCVGKVLSPLQSSTLNHSFIFNAAWPSSLLGLGLSSGLFKGVRSHFHVEKSGLATVNSRGLKLVREVQEDVVGGVVEAGGARAVRGGNLGENVVGLQ